MSAPGPDGFYHPSSEAELADLVRSASERGLQLRVRGAAHSISHAIYTDPLAGWPNSINEQSPPPGPNIDVMLDRYRGWRVRDESRKLVEADAGIHMGEDRTNPENASLTTSLLWQLWNDKGWALSNLGGITRQTVSGFTATGSSGGSVKYSVNDNLWGFRVIDSNGNVHEVTREDADPGPFLAMAPNLGLLGVVSKIIFECVDTFNIAGQEAITTVEDCEIDLFGPGTAEKPSLEAFLRDAEYARVEWWPQRGAERVQVWQAQRIRPQLGFHRRTYEEFTDEPRTQVAISLIYTFLSNLDDLSQAKPQIARTFARAEKLLETSSPLEKLGPLGWALANVLAFAGKLATDALIDLLKPLAGTIERKLPCIFPFLLSFFVSLDSQKRGTAKGEPQAFQDEAWHGLPMDNESDDDLLPIAFTEAWVPLGRTKQVMLLLREYFTSPADVHESYRRTGLFAWELYAAKPTPFWMSASHEQDEEWRDGVFRIDPFWFAGTPVDPSETFYLQFWELLRDNDIPFRLHWGKYQPAPDAGAGGWVAYFRSQYPRWNDFLALRAERDPHGTFLTSYWRERIK